MVEVCRERSEETVDGGGRVAGEKVRLVQFEHGEGDTEEKDGAVDEEEIPNATTEENVSIRSR